MNKFESNFFKKYIPEWLEIKWIIHSHFIEIYSLVFLWLCMWALFPSMLYYYSERIRDLIPFYYLEWLLIIIFIKIIYDIFDWYNDVWIVSNNSVVQLKRSLFKIDSTSIDFDKIEWIEVEQNWILDKLLKKWDLIIHKFGNETMILKNSINPFKWADLIENISELSTMENNSKNEHFDVIMDALWGVVENYLEKKNNKSSKEIERETIIEKAKNSDWSIDLR